MLVFQMRATPATPSTVDLGPALVESIWIEMVVATLVLGTRLYTRARVVGKISIDDWLMLFGYVDFPKLVKVRALADLRSRFSP